MNSTLVIFFYLIFLDFLVVTYKRIKNYSFSILFLFLGFFIVFATYKGLNSDWRVYRGYFENASYLGSSDFEKGFDFLLFLSNKLGSFELIPLFALYSFFLLFIILYKEKIFGKTDYFIILFSFYCSFLPLYFGALRQAIASNFLFIFFTLFYKQKYKKSCIFLILCILFHKSSLLILAIYIIFRFYCYITRKMKSELYIVSTILIVVVIYLLLRVTIEKLFIALNMEYRLGNNENYTSNSIKDLFILAERIVFIFLSFILLKSKKSLIQYFAKIYLGGNFFYCIFYSLARNLAGRTLAFYRYLDVYFLYESIRILLPKIVIKCSRNISYCDKDSINKIALLLCILYSLIKYYITVIRSGVF